MKGLEHTLLAIVVAVVAVAGTAHARSGSDPCWLWRDVMRDTGAPFYFNLTAFAHEQTGEATNDDDVVYAANICNYTRGKHCGLRASVCLNIDGDYYHAGDYRDRVYTPLARLQGMQLSMVGSDVCASGRRFRSLFTFECRSGSNKTEYKCSYDKKECALTCKVLSEHACYILGDP